MTRKTQKKLRKLLTLVSCAVLLVCVTIAGTVAYLQHTTDVVENTFTVGANVVIDLDEAPVGDDGKKITGDRVKKNDYTLVPGYTYDKDPTVRVKTGTGDCYVFVKVVNPFTAIEAAENTIAAQMTKYGWHQLVVNGQNVENVFYYGTAEKATIQNNEEGTVDKELVVFETFTTNNNLTHDDLTFYNKKQIEVTAYAIQADGFADHAAAWTAGSFN